MDRPLLSICIPTYNRAEYLEKSLASLVAQDGFPLVEVVISDNCSSDDTAGVCRSYCSRYPNIVYHRNEENILDRNFPSVLMLAHGAYRKLFNDTIIYGDGCLRYLAGIVRKYSASRPFLFFLNGQRLPEKIAPVAELESFERFCVITGHRLTWIVGFGLWEGQCGNLEDEFPYCGTNLWQTYKALRIVSEDGRCVLVTERIFSVQSVRRRDYSHGLYTVFYKNFPALLSPYIRSGKLSESAFQEIRRDMLYTQAAPWLFRMPETLEEADFGNEANYKELILREYRREPYYPRFVIWNFFHYGLREIRRRPFIMLKRLAVRTAFGRRLLDMKRRMNLKFY